MTEKRKPARLGEEQRRDLRFVHVHDGAVDLALFPDFLVIGPQRTGSTWLHRNLARHPQIQMSEPKELYYFDSIQWPDYRPAHLKDISNDLDWYLRFFAQSDETVKRRDAECRRQFDEPYAPLVRGESSATYAVECEPSIIHEMLVLNPAIKAILLVRHPHERAWSHMKKDYHMDGGRAVETISVDDCERFLASEYHRNCGFFSTMIEKWSASLPEGSFFIGDFRDVDMRPAALLQRLFRFVGVRDDVKYVGELANRTICATPPDPIPPQLKPLLDGVYAEEIARLRELGFTWS